jgi:CcmD family protein
MSALHLAVLEIPLHEAVPYVAGAYCVFFALILLYLAIMSGRLSRIERELGELTELAARRLHGAGGAGGSGEGAGDAP